MVGNLKYGERATIRGDKKRKPYYLTKLPFYKKYPKAFVLVGSLTSFFIFMSAPIYKLFIASPENRNPNDYLWPSEIQRGETNRERLLKKYNPEKYALVMEEKKKAQQQGSASA